MQKNQVLTLLYGSQANNSKNLNHKILKGVMTYIKAATRFDGSLTNF